MGQKLKLVEPFDAMLARAFALGVRAFGTGIPRQDGQLLGESAVEHKAWLAGWNVGAAETHPGFLLSASPYAPNMASTARMAAMKKASDSDRPGHLISAPRYSYFQNHEPGTGQHKIQVTA
jgi:hypothetical protein